MSTFVFPTFVADGTLSEVKLPTFVSDGSLVIPDMHLPAYAMAVRATGFLPTYLTGTIYFAMVPTGGMKMGGGADIFGDPVVPSGGMKMGGTALVDVNPAPTGGMKMGGSAVVSSVIVNIYDINALDAEPEGGMQMGGVAIIAENITYVPTGGMLKGGSAIVQEHIPCIPTGGMLMSGIADVVSAFVVLPTGGMVMGGIATPTLRYVELPTGGMMIGGAAVVNSRVSLHAPSGGMVMGGAALAYMVPSNIVTTTENPYGNAFPGWAINFETHAPSRYMGLPAKGITQFGGRTFVANDGGLYEISADNDAGQPIRASIEFPTTDFQDSREKRMEVAYIGVKVTGRMVLKVKVNGKDPQYYSIIPSGNNPKGTRVKIGKGLVGRYWGERLDNVDGSDFELESVEFNPYSGQRHGA